MSTQGDGYRNWTFGDYRVNTDRGSLECCGQEIPLRPQSFKVLCYLVERHGRLVSKKELMDAIWGRKAVTDDSLTHCLIDIRKALGDDARQMVRTLPRRGFIFEVDVAETSTREVKPLIAVNYWRLAALVAIVTALFTVWSGYSTTPGDGPDATLAATPNPKSIAVLPFVDMSESSDQEYFAVGMSEEIINVLASIEDLQVIARTSSFIAADQGLDIAQIARRLNTKFVLEGSVRKSGKRVRVTAQLIDGDTMAHAWSETYEHQLGDVFAVQQAIASAVAGVLQTSLRAGIESTGNSRAYESYWQGRFFYNRRGPNDVVRAQDYFATAIEIDPEFAPAWAGLAATYWISTYEGQIEFESGRALMREAAETAVKLDPTHAEARIRLIQAYWIGGEEELAAQQLALVTSEHPNNSLVLAVAAGEAARNRNLETAIELQRRATSIDPLSTVNQNNLAGYLKAAGRYREAIVANRRKLDLSPAQLEETDGELAQLLILLGQSHEALEIVLQCPKGNAQDFGLALAYYELGEFAEADAAVARLNASPDLGAVIGLAEIFAHRGNPDRSFEHLDFLLESIRSESVPFVSDRYLTDVRYSPFLRPLHDDSRWEDWMVAAESAIERKMDELLAGQRKVALRD